MKEKPLLPIDSYNNYTSYITMQISHTSNLISSRDILSGSSGTEHTRCNSIGLNHAWSVPTRSTTSIVGLRRRLLTILGLIHLLGNKHIATSGETTELLLLLLHKSESTLQIHELN